MLYVHLSRAAVEGIGTARFEQGNQLVTAGQVRDWCHTAGSVVVKPVIDLEAHDPVDTRRRARSGTPRLTTVRDRTCVFPWCTRPARRCDTDHTIPHSRGGPTCPCNLAPLCRRHHRIKTHGGWSYTTLEPGHYLWTSKHGYQYLRDPDGTLDVSHDRHRPPATRPDLMLPRPGPRPCAGPSARPASLTGFRDGCCATSSTTDTPSVVEEGAQRLSRNPAACAGR